VLSPYSLLKYKHEDVVPHHSLLFDITEEKENKRVEGRVCKLKLNKNILY